MICFSQKCCWNFTHRPKSNDVVNDLRSEDKDKNKDLRLEDEDMDNYYYHEIVHRVHKNNKKIKS